MYILSADTTAKTAAVCISKYSDGVLKPVSQASVNGTLTHSESLLPMIDFCLKNSGITFADIDISAITAGPGSFTGVRIGVSTIKGLAFANGKCACVGVSTLEALAYNLHSVPAGSIILPLMDARRNQFYNADFVFTRSGKLKRLSKDNLCVFDEIIERLQKDYKNKKIILVGDGAELFYSSYMKGENIGLNIKLCDYADMYQNGFSVAKAALCLYNAIGDKSAFTPEKLNPVYLRASQAERERNEKLSEKGTVK